MLRHVYGLIGIALALYSPPLTADELPLGDALTGYPPLKPALVGDGSWSPHHDGLPEGTCVRGDTQPSGTKPVTVPTALAGAALARSPGPQPTGVFLPWGVLLNHWLASQALSLQIARSLEDARRPPPAWGAPQQAATHPYRVDGALRLTRSGSLVSAKENTVEGSLAATLAAQVGSTSRTRATTSVTGTVRTQVVVHPWEAANRGPVESGSGEKNGKESGESGRAGVHLLVATKEVYKVHPRTGTVTTQGELLGSFHWQAAEGRFRQDPWGLVSVRWRPAVSCEGGGPLGSKMTKAEETGSPPARLMGRVRGDLRLDFLTPRLVLSGDYQYGQGLSRAPYAWDFTTLSWTYQLSAQISVGGSFTQGRRLPDLPTEHGVTMELGVQF